MNQTADAIASVSNRTKRFDAPGPINGSVVGIKAVNGDATVTVMNTPGSESTGDYTIINGDVLWLRNINPTLVDGSVLVYFA